MLCPVRTPRFAVAQFRLLKFNVHARVEAGRDAFGDDCLQTASASLGLCQTLKRFRFEVRLCRFFFRPRRDSVARVSLWMTCPPFSHSRPHHVHASLAPAHDERAQHHLAHADFVRRRRHCIAGMALEFGHSLASQTQGALRINFPAVTSDSSNGSVGA